MTDMLRVLKIVHDLLAFLVLIQAVVQLALLPNVERAILFRPDRGNDKAAQGKA